MTVDILLATYNGLPFLREQLESLQAQTHGAWQLWVRDDGSTDGTVEVLRSFAARDKRIRILAAGGHRLGAAGSFAWLVNNALGEPRYVMFCDQDDRWLPTKIAATLAAMLQAESDAGPHTPVLVHTDLAVADADLKVIDESFWEYQALDPLSATLEQLFLRNTVTGCTAMINAPLCALVQPIPAAAAMHDWWVALAAHCFGRVVPLAQATVLYRQHAGNAVGATRRQHRSDVAERVRLAFRGAAERQLALCRAKNQAQEFLRRYGHTMEASTRSLVSGVVDYLTVRTDLVQHRRSSRLHPVLRQVSTGRYARLGNGLSSAIRDLVF